MNSFIVHPLEPLIFGNGRPFNTQPGSQAAGGRALPMPSTFAGSIRTAIGRQSEISPTSEDWARIAEVPVHGPVLLQDGQVMMPAPSDMALLQSQGSSHLVRLRPGDYADWEGTNLPEKLRPLLLPAELAGLEPSKVTGPKWLTIPELAAWYLDGPLWGEVCRSGAWRLHEGGPWQERTIDEDARVHVGIDPVTLAHKTGLIYETRGAAFRPDQRLLGRVAQSLPKQALTLGGERRMATLDPCDPSLWRCPSETAKALTATKQVAMVLITPAQFANGWAPTELSAVLNADVNLVGAAMRRREAVSGWDLATRAPKPIHWLVPAGAVFFLELSSGADRLVEKWLTPVSDSATWRNDGFGLAAFFPTSW